MSNSLPHVVVIVPRGEAVRNFIYSNTLKLLSEKARVTLLSVVDDSRVMEHARPYVEEIITITERPEHTALDYLRHIVHNAHYRWLWSKVAQNIWEWRDATTQGTLKKIQRALWKAGIRVLANRPTIELLSEIERRATWALRIDNTYIELFKRLKPDLVFNTSHIHGLAGELPAKIAHHMGIPTVGFIFSWDNLTSRSRILVPYDYYFVWHTGMRDQLLSLYPNIKPERVFVTGTPQFDFHFDDRFCLSRQELAEQTGIDPKRPFVLYTTGIAHHFPEEHRTVELVIKLLENMEVTPKPQLVVRTYVKDTSPEMQALADHGYPDVFFPPALWEKKWFTPLHEDLSLYTSLLRYASLGINAASTVSLELIIHDKPVINLGFNPPGSDIPTHNRYIRHIEFDHYAPVAASGAVMVAKSPEDMKNFLHQGLTCPEAASQKREQFRTSTFGDTLDSHSGQRIAEKLVELCARQPNKKEIS